MKEIHDVSRVQAFSMVLLTVFALAMMLAACVPNFMLRPSTRDIVMVASTTPTVANPAATVNADNHFLQIDDFFIMDNTLDGHAWIYSAIAKMTWEPSPDTDNQGQFLRGMDGQSIWTRHWVRTRKATRADLVIGRKVIFLDRFDQYGNYRSPMSNQEARANWWLHSRIVDLSELFRGVVMVGEGMMVNESALRVVVE
ncbi:MAG: hypothetical protein Q8J62_00130 [Candidatus Cloacimonadaceae bacterium]|nr:hypothetical protein [Candidatus Cloacimonadaceae bacterium]